MGYMVKFEDGSAVNFDTQPTQADIDEAYQHVKGSNANQVSPNVSTQAPQGALPGSETIPGGTPMGPSAVDNYAEQQRQSLLQRAGAGIEAGINTGAGLIGGAITGPLALATNLANRGYRSLTGQGTQGLPSAEEAFNSGAGMLSEPLTQMSSPLGQEYTGKVGEFMNEALPGLMHLHAMLPEINQQARVANVARSMQEEVAGKPAINPPPSSRLAGLASEDTAQPTAAPTSNLQAPTQDTRSPTQLAQEALASAQRERQLQQQSAFNRPDSLPDLTQQETPMQRMARELGAPELSDQSFGNRSGISDMANRLTEDRPTVSDLSPDEASLKAKQDAQNAIDARQQELELAVKRQANLDSGASERQRQEAASAVSSAHQAFVDEFTKQSQADENARIANDSKRMGNATQMSIDDTEHVPPDSNQVIAPQYGAMQGVGRFDENGMPIRADLSMEAQNLENPNQRSLWGDQLAPKSEQEANNLMLPLGSAARAALRGPSRAKQGGALFMGDGSTLQGVRDQVNKVAHFASDVSENISDFSRKVLNYRYNADHAGPDYVKTIVGDTANATTKFKAPDSVADAVTKITQSGMKDVPSMGYLSKSVQSGMDMMAAKFKENPLMLDMSRRLNYAANQTQLQIRQLVDPIKRTYGSLPIKDMIDVQGALKQEMFRGAPYTEEQLRRNGFTDTMVTAYKMQRAAYDAVYNLQNKGRALLGMDPITKRDNYFASTWHGDWHMPILNKEGKLAWYVRTTSEKEGLTALKYLKENVQSLDIPDNVKPIYRGNSRNPLAPADVSGAYHDMQDYFKDDPQMSSAIQEALKGYMEDKAYNIAGQNKHFLEKSNVRGFEGDKPWLSDKQNAYNGAKAQMDYLAAASKWANHQQAIAEAKEVLTHPDVKALMPHAVEMSNHILNHVAGLNKELTTNIANTIAEMAGTSRSSLVHLVGDTKTMMYLQTLGLNTAYAIATPMQYGITGPMWHSVLSSQGYKTGIIGGAATIAKAFGDSSAGILTHMGHELGINGQVPMTELGKRALQYAEDAGIVSRNLFEEGGNLGQHAMLGALQKSLGWTIGFPEKVARMNAFMGFVHHLDASGKFAGDEAGLFRLAQEYTGRAMTSFEGHDRPTIVSDLGTVGQLGYVYKSYVFNQAHTMNAAARMLSRGNPTPLLALVAGYSLMSGITNAPMVNELDGLWNSTKNVMARAFPEQYVNNWLTGPMANTDLKAGIIKHLPETAGIRGLLQKGIATSLTGADIGNHMSGQILDTEHPTQNIPGSVLAQESKEWGSVGKAVYHHNADGTLSAVYNNVPPVAKGVMESNISNFKSGNNPNNQLMYKPGDLNAAETMEHRRDQKDTAYRNLGLTSWNEAQDKRNIYRTNQDEANNKLALSALEEHMRAGIKQGDYDKLAGAATAYKTLNPSADMDSTIKRVGVANYTTPMERKEMEMKTVMGLQYYQRYQGQPK